MSGLVEINNMSGRVPKYIKYEILRELLFVPPNHHRHPISFTSMFGKRDFVSSHNMKYLKTQTFVKFVDILSVSKPRTNIGELFASFCYTVATQKKLNHRWANK